MVSIITGLERYNVERTIKKMLEGVEESEVSVLEGRFDSLAVKRLADTTSIFSERKGILCRCRNLSGNDLTAIRSLSDQHTSDDVVIVIVYESLTGNAKAALKTLEKIHVICNKLTEKERDKLVQFVGGVAKNQGVRCTRAGAEELIRRSDYYGQDDVNLFTVILLTEQVSLLGDVTEENVKTAIKDTPAEKAYKLINMLLEKDGKSLVENSRKILESKESTEIGLLQLLAKPFRLAWLERNAGRGCTGQKEYSFEKVMRLSDDVISRCCDILDTAISNSMEGLKPRVAFDLAIAELIAIM